MVSLAGGQRPAIRVQMNAAALAAYKMSAEDVRSAINSANAKSTQRQF